MAKLKSTENQKFELARRKIAERLAIVRGRVEVDRDCGFMPLIEKAEIQLHLLDLRGCDDIIKRVDESLARREQERVDARVANDIDEQSVLLAQRGVKTEKVGGINSRDGFVWLERKSRLSSDQLSTGKTIRVLYDRSTWDGLRSKAGNDNGSGDGATYLPSQACLEAKDQLRHVKDRMNAAAGSDGPFDLVIAVCGVGATLATIAGGDERRAIVLEGQLALALDMANVALEPFRGTRTGGRSRDAA